MIDILTEESVIREKQTERLRIKTKEEAQAAQEMTESAGRRTAGASGKLSDSSTGRIKSKGQMEKMSKSGNAVREQGRRTYQAGKQLAGKGKSMTGKTAKIILFCI